MKKQFVSKNVKASFVRFGAATLLFMSLTQASAQTADADTDPFVNITYAGTVKDQAQFQFDMVNDNAEQYLLVIQGDDGLVLYKEKIDKRTFTKKFVLDNSDLQTAKLVFSVTGLKSKKSQTYEITPQVRTVRDVIISKL
ncbi:MAG TPA: hypothetical protein VGN63_08360 [Flavisolibacter sp.]|jgi:hypothetical protein|nr:hypothetical protein [Flavisolibacter sp.]